MSIVNTIIWGGVAVIAVYTVGGILRPETGQLRMRLGAWGVTPSNQASNAQLSGSPYPETIATMQQKQDAISTYESTSGVDIDPITERQMYEGHFFGERYEMGMGDPSNP